MIRWHPEFRKVDRQRNPLLVKLAKGLLTALLIPSISIGMEIPLRFFNHLPFGHPIARYVNSVLSSLFPVTSLDIDTGILGLDTAEIAANDTYLHTLLEESRIKANSNGLYKNSVELVEGFHPSEDTPTIAFVTDDKGRLIPIGIVKFLAGQSLPKTAGSANNVVVYNPYQLFIKNFPNDLLLQDFFSNNPNLKSRLKSRENLIYEKFIREDLALITTIEKTENGLVLVSNPSIEIIPIRDIRLPEGKKHSLALLVQF